jgi:hypothetical protein
MRLPAAARGCGRRADRDVRFPGPRGFGGSSVAAGVRVCPRVVWRDCWKAGQRGWATCGAVWVTYGGVWVPDGAVQSWLGRLGVKVRRRASTGGLDGAQVGRLRQSGLRGEGRRGHTLMARQSVSVCQLQQPPAVARPACGLRSQHPAFP